MTSSHPTRRDFLRRSATASAYLAAAGPLSACSSRLSDVKEDMPQSGIGATAVHQADEYKPRTDLVRKGAAPEVPGGKRFDLQSSPEYQDAIVAQSASRYHPELQSELQTHFPSLDLTDLPRYPMAEILVDSLGENHGRVYGDIGPLIDYMCRDSLSLESNACVLHDASRLYKAYREHEERGITGFQNVTGLLSAIESLQSRISLEHPQLIFDGAESQAYWTPEEEWINNAYAVKLIDLFIPTADHRIGAELGLRDNDHDGIVDTIMYLYAF